MDIEGFLENFILLRRIEKSLTSFQVYVSTWHHC